jgi:hypothetical protein
MISLPPVVFAEPERDRRGVHMRRWQLQLVRTLRLGRRAVGFWIARKSGTVASFFRVTDGIFYFGFSKTFEPQETRIALTAGESFG